MNVLIEASSLARRRGEYCPAYLMFTAPALNGLMAACHLRAGHEGKHDSPPFSWADGQAGQG